MPRIIITTDSPQRTGDAVVLLDERIHAIHLSTEHASSQLVERLAWAVSDAADIELERQALATHRAHLARAERRGPRRTGAARARTRHATRA